MIVTRTESLYISLGDLRKVFKNLSEEVESLNVDNSRIKEVYELIKVLSSDSNIELEESLGKGLSKGDKASILVSKLYALLGEVPRDDSVGLDEANVLCELESEIVNNAQYV